MESIVNDARYALQQLRPLTQVGPFSNRTDTVRDRAQRAVDALERILTNSCEMIKFEMIKESDDIIHTIYGDF